LKDWKKVNRFRSLLILAVLSLGTASSALGLAHAASSGKYFDYSVTILMENNDLQSVLSQGTYQASLAHQYVLLTGYSAVSHPSEPNYVALLGGSTNGISNDGVCCFTIPASNLVDRLESAGLSWKAYAEDASGSGTCSFSPPRSGDHFPFLDYQDINTAARCANFASTTSSGDSEFISYLNSASPSNYIWLTPNDNDNSHDTPISSGDAYLSALVPQILSSNLFKNQRAALFIVYDEGNDASCATGGSDCVYASWSGPVAKRGFTSNSSYTHYSYVHTMEDNWGMATLASNDANAPVMAEAFGTSSSGPAGSSSPSCVYCILGYSQTISLLIIAGVLVVVAASTLLVARSRRGRKRRVSSKAS
jgi:phosphatidylinositol-3-phosphatase